MFFNFRFTVLSYSRTYNTYSYIAYMDFTEIISKGKKKLLVKDNHKFYCDHEIKPNGQKCYQCIKKIVM